MSEQIHETVNVAESWGVRLATGEIHRQGQGYTARQFAHSEVERIAHNAKAEKGRGGPGIGWATTAHPAEVVSRIITTTITSTNWVTHPTNPPDDSAPVRDVRADEGASA